MIKSLFKSFLFLSLFSFILNFSLLAESQVAPSSPYPTESSTAPQSPYPTTSSTAPTSPYPTTSAAPSTPYPTAASTAPTSPYPTTSAAPSTPYPTAVSTAPKSPYPTTSAVPTAVKSLGTSGAQSLQQLSQIDTGLREGETQLERAARVSQAGAQAIQPTIQEAGKAAQEAGKAASEIAALFKKRTHSVTIPEQALMQVAREPIFYDDGVYLYFDIWKRKGKPSYLDSSGGVLGINQIPAETSKWVLIDPSQSGKNEFRSGDLVLLYNPETSSYIKMGSKKEVIAEQLNNVPTADAFKWHVFDLTQIDPKILTQTGKEFLKNPRGMPIGNPITDGSKVALGNFSITSKANNEHRWLRLPAVSVFKSKTPKIYPELQNKVETQETLVIEKTEAPLAVEDKLKEKPTEIEVKPEILLPELPKHPAIEDIISVSEFDLTNSKKELEALKTLESDELKILEKEDEVAALEAKVAQEKLLDFRTRITNYIEKVQKVVASQPADIKSKLEEIFKDINDNLNNIALSLENDFLKAKDKAESVTEKLQQLRISTGKAPALPARAERPTPPPLPARNEEVAIESTAIPPAPPAPPLPEGDKIPGAVPPAPGAAEPQVSTGVVPPPPPPPPAPPAPPATSGLKPATGQRSDLLADIAKGKTLKKVEEQPVTTTSKATDAKGSLLEDIRKTGQSGLKTVEKSAVQPGAEKKKSGDLASSIAATIDARRRDIADDETEDEPEDWDDN